MAMFCVRISDDLAARFDAAAVASGGRSAVLRRLICESGAAAPLGEARAKSNERTTARLMVRLAAKDAAELDAEARRMGIRRAAWVAALVRRRVRDEPTFSRSDELLLLGLRSELRRIGVNVNQIARALNTAVLEGRVLDSELAALDDFRRELRGHVLALGEAFEGNLAYWAVGT